MDNSLKKIIQSGLQSISKMFSSRAPTMSALGIDIGSSAIKVVQLKKEGGKAVLETYGSLALGPYANVEVGQITNLSADDMARALIDVMKESNTTIKTGAIAIPSLASLIFTISLPAQITEKDFATVIPTEARKYIPVPVSEVTLDWFVIPREAEKTEESLSMPNPATTQSKPVEDKTEVLVVAIHNDTLSRYRDVLTKTQIASQSFEMEVFSTIRSSFSRDVAPVLLMDFGASKTKLSIVEAGIVRVFHVVNRGSFDITKNIATALNVPFTEAEQLKRAVGLDARSNAQVADIVRLSTDYIFSDTNSVVLAYEKKYNKNISKVILTGGGSLLKGLLERAAVNFHTEVVYGDPFSKTEAPAFLEPVLKTSGPEFACAVGLALRELSA